MKIISWNVQGMGNPGTVQYLARLVRFNCLHIIFLMEIKIGRTEYEEVRRRLPGFNLFIVDAKGRLGGLALLWKRELKLNIVGFSTHCINFCIVDSSGGLEWKGSGIYRWPEMGKKHLTWKLIKEIRQQDDIPCLCFRDFNEITYSSKKVGGAERDYCAMESFRNCLWDSDLFDTSFKGAQFTWTNRRKGAQAVFERLHRFLKMVE